MKLSPPEVEIDPQNPFKGDLLSRKDFAESITNILSNIEDNLVIFVNGPWGEGKTTFCRMWKQQLLNDGYKTIYFDAYASDYSNDPFITFTSEIHAFIDEEFKDDITFKKGGTKLKKSAAKLGKAFLKSGVSAGMNAITFGAINSSTIEEIKPFLKELAGGISTATSELIESQIEEYTKEKQSFEDFKKSLEGVGKKIRETQGFPLTFIIDELDRCRPDYALKLLERIKHLFDVQDICFVLFINREQLEKYVKYQYGNDANAHVYLQKFAHLTMDLPPTRRNDFQNDYRDYCHHLYSHFRLKPDGNQRMLVRVVDQFAAHLNLSLREMGKVFTILTIYYAALTKKQLTDAVLVAVLSIVKIKLPETFARLKSKSITYEEFIEDIRFRHFQKDNVEKLNLQLLQNYFQFGLLEENKWSAIEEESHVKGLGGDWVLHNMSRLEAIPLICRDLDHFNLSNLG